MYSPVVNPLTKREGGITGPRTDRFIFVALLVLMCLSATPYAMGRAWWDALFEFIVFALGVLWSAKAVLDGELNLTRKKLFVPLILILILACFQCLTLGGVNSNVLAYAARHPLPFSADPHQTYRFILKLAALLLAGELLLRATARPRQLQLLINLLLIIGVLSAFLGILRKTVFQNTPGFEFSQEMQEVSFGQFANRNHFAYLMEMTLGLTFGLIAGSWRSRKRLLLYLGAAIPMFAALVMTVSRGAIISLMGQIVFIAATFHWAASFSLRPSRHASKRGPRFLWWRRGRSFLLRGILAVSLVFVVGVGIVWIGGEKLANRLERESVQSELSSSNIDTHLKARRLEIWRATWLLIKENPVFGIGFGAYQYAIPKYFDYSGRWTLAQAHNDYLELLASGGIIGAVLALWAGWVMTIAIRQRMHRLDAYRRAACYGALTGLIGVAIHSFFDFGLHITFNAFVATALFAIAIGGDPLKINSESAASPTPLDSDPQFNCESLRFVLPRDVEKRLFASDRSPSTTHRLFYQA